LHSPLNRLSPADYISALNGLSGFLAISFFFSGEMVKGTLMISMAVLFDGLDGIVARRYGGPHGRGMQVDSLADVISFCAAPAVALYVVYHGIGSTAMFSVSIFASLLFVFLGIVRLSAFSREGYSLSYFRGLPTPSASLIITSSLLIIGKEALPDNSWAGLPLAFAMSVLMVLPLKYPKPRGPLAVVSAIILLIFISLLSISFYTGYGFALYGSFLVLISTSAYIIAGPFYCGRHCPPKTI